MLYKALKGLTGPSKALKGLIRPPRAFQEPFKSLHKLFERPLEDSSGLMRPLGALGSFSSVSEKGENGRVGLIKVCLMSRGS